MNTTATAGSDRTAYTPPSRFTAFDSQVLEARGITEETAIANGLYTERSGGKLAMLLKWKESATDIAPALVIPFTKDYARARPQKPRKKKKKPVKYEAPVGSRSHAYIPIEAREAIRTLLARLLITEGELKTLKASQDGFPTIGIVGVDNWHPAKSRNLIPDLQTIDWKNRPVFIVFDSDRSTNENVLRNERELAAALSQQGAIVRVVELPPGVDDKGNEIKQGLDDFLVNNGPEALEKLIAEAVEPEVVEKEEFGIRNFEIEYGEKGEPITVPVPMADVLAKIYELTESWPRRVGSSLFTHDNGQVHWLDSSASLFGWLASKTGIVEWSKVTGCVTKEEVTAELRRTAPSYIAVESLPHFPPLANHFYTCGEIKPGDGKALQGFLDRFSTATEIDRDLLQAACMTPVWGGDGGTRPAFLITSNDGRGVGKSKMAAMICELFGGALDFSSKDDIQAIKTRLLSTDALTRRVALLDNVKSSRFSWAELEALITAPSVSGHRMYVGESSRPNGLTWIVTLNGASLSADMAQRVVVLKVKRPTHSGEWEDDTKRFVATHRAAIIADLMALFQKPPAVLGKFSRWGSWEKQVLARLADPTAAQAAIEVGQKEVDAEDDECETIVEFFAGQLKKLGYGTDTQRIFIPSEIAARWFNWSMNEKRSPVAAMRLLNQMINEGKLTKLSNKVGRSDGRGLVWVGNSCGNLCHDIKDRMADRKSGQFQESPAEQQDSEVACEW